MDILIDDANVERLLLSVGIDVPFIETRRWDDAPLPTLPRLPVARAGLDGFDSGVDGAVGSGHPLREVRYQPPPHQGGFAGAVDRPNHRYQLGRCHVEARGEFQFRADEIELALNRSIIGAYVAAAHGLRNHASRTHAL